MRRERNGRPYRRACFTLWRMEMTELLPRLHQVDLDFGQVYPWRDGDELTLLDTGVPGSGNAGAAMRAALDQSARP